MIFIKKKKNLFVLLFINASCVRIFTRAYFLYIFIHTYIGKFMYLLCFFYGYKTPQKRVIVRDVPNLTYTRIGGA